MKFDFKMGSFFCKVIGYKMKIKGVIKNLKIKKLKLKNDDSKIYLGISLELLRAGWGQFSFRYFLVPSYTSSQGL